MRRLLMFFIVISAFQVNAQNYPYQVINATEAYSGKYAQGYISIKYINPANPVLQRPLIVAEGYDPGEIIKPEEPFGVTNINNGFLNEATNSVTRSAQLAALLDGGTQQYDVVYVDWKNGTDYLQRNALLLEQVIRTVNSQKVPVNGVIQPNVILGQSMGGLIARYALRDMENKGGVTNNHQTRLFISWDAPHQGAFVPEGFGHMLRQGRDVYVQTGAVGATVDIIQFTHGEITPGLALNLADQPASRQMLINYVNPSNNVDNTMHNSWQTDLKNMDYPQGFLGGFNFTMVAVSNGSECAEPQDINPGDNLLTFQGKANTKILADLGLSGVVLSSVGSLLNQPALVTFGTLPGRNEFTYDLAVNAQADGTVNQLYKGKITYTKKILWLIPVTAVITDRSYNSNAATFPYEHYAGGYYPIPINLNLQDQDLQTRFFNLNITAHSAQRFGFVTVPSALDIGRGNVTLTKNDYLTPYVGTNPPLAPKATPFQNFVTAFNGSSDNEQHTEITRRNGDWVADRLQNTNNTAPSCGIFFCSGFAAAGPSEMCNNSSITLTLPLPTGATAVWNAPSWITVTPQNQQGSIVTVTSNTQSGLANIGVTVSPGTSVCGGSPVILSKLIKVGAPNLYTLISSYNTLGYSGSLQDNNCLKTYDFPGMYSGTVDLDDQVATSYAWTYITKNPSTATVGIGPTSTPQHVTITVKPQHATVTYRLTTTNACGSFSKNYLFNADGPCIQMRQAGSGSSSSSISVTPNPVTGTCKVELTPGNDEAVIQQIMISDKFGSIIKQYQYKNGGLSQLLDLSTLTTDMYVVQVFDGSTWISEKIMKE